MEQAQQTTITLSEFAEKLSAKLIGDGAVPVSGINTIQDADEHQVCFLTSQKHLKGLEQTKAAAVIVDKPLEGCSIAQIVVDNANRGLIAALEIFAPKLKTLSGIHPTAVVDPNAEVDASAAIGPHAVIAAGVKIDAHCVIGANVTVGQNTTIGAHSRLDNNVVVYHNCQIGSRCVIQANTTIGATGFGYAYIDGQHRLIPHNGGVILEDGVEIGANSCVDRAKFGDTVIGAGTKIDNQVQIGHNVKIGKLCLLAGQAGVGGSAKVGNGVMFGGRSGLIDNRTIGDGAVVCVASVATKDVPPGQAVLGMPPQEMQHELRCTSIYQRLPEMAKQLKELTKKVEQLDAAKND